MSLRLVTNTAVVDDAGNEFASLTDTEFNGLTGCAFKLGSHNQWRDWARSLSRSEAYWLAGALVGADVFRDEVKFLLALDGCES